MRFPLADWIDDHAACRYHFGASGMRGFVRPPDPTPREVRDASEDELRRRLAELLEVDRRRVFLAPGATEANAWVTWFVGRSVRGRVPRCRVAYPEYPPLFDGARAAGYRLVPGDDRPVDLAVVSQPRNPEGVLWSRERLTLHADRARATVVDETFREFSPARSTLHWEIPGTWATGSFTKAYGGDDIRVGFVAAPENDQDAFARFHGLVADEMATHSVAAALATLAARSELLRRVRAVVRHNQAVWHRWNPGHPVLAGPVAFDTPVSPDGERLARRALSRSVLVCPGGFFGAPRGVRVGLTRPSFPTDLPHYLEVRDEGKPPLTARVGSDPGRRGPSPRSRDGAGPA
jgi:histidinol-phosphate/aromatic aminotransferase/cobyric acid decarboxylase-like protein